MAKKRVKTVSRFIGGIAEFKRESTNADAYAFGRSIDVRSDPQSLTILPRTIKESGTVIQALPKWGEFISSCDKTYIYDEAGNIYDRDSTGTYSLLHKVVNSHGNGMSWFGEDNFIYYTSDKLIGRYGPVCSTSPTFVDDFFGSQGGIPLNTNSIDFEASSSQYASRADTASLSITGNLSLECWIKPESLPSSGQTMTLISKWTENGNLRSYKFGIGTVSNFFGDGSDGALTISTNTTEAPIDSACSGTSGSYALTATNVSFAAGQMILIHQTQGTNAGGWQRNKIQSYTAGTITLETPLNMNYSSSGTSRAQVRVIKQYTNVTINAGVTYTAKAWNGTTGGILAFFSNGTLTVNGSITGTGCGYRGASGITGAYNPGKQGEGYGSSVYDGVGEGANYNGGGGGRTATSGSGGQSGGGGAHTTNGGRWMPIPGIRGNDAPAYGGNAVGAQDLTTSLFFGGGGGSGSTSYNGGVNNGPGGTGGGILLMASPTVIVNTGGSIVSGGAAGQTSTVHAGGGGGGGAGGAILLYAQDATLGTNLVTVPGGYGGLGGAFSINGGGGSEGRFHIDYLTSYTGTSNSNSYVDPKTNPVHDVNNYIATSMVTLYSTQDPNLGSSSGYTLFLSISNNGTTVTTYTKPADLLEGIWQHVACAYDYSVGDTEIFLNGTSLGTVLGSSVTISDNASTFNIAMDRDGSSNPQHFYDGLMDSVRVWAGVLTVDDVLANKFKQINPASSGLMGYYQFNGVATDATSYGNNLTLTGGPPYSDDVPFPSATTRIDIDQVSSTSGDTYALKTAVSESSADKKSFTPTKDPQKSLRVYIVAKGTGNWTLKIHDQYNNEIASKTYLNAALPASGDFEFVFDEVWRPLTNFTNAYHFHIISTVADGTIRSSSNNDLSTVDFTTYYQFLVDDTSFHPVAKMLQFLVFGNERYVASLEATIYDPHTLTLPAGYRVRCFGYWQEYLAIGVIKGDSITDQDMGRIYFWDGVASTYNFYVDVPQGGVTALLGAQGLLFVWAGYQTDMLVYSGGNSVTRLRRLPFMEPTAYAEIYPGAVTMWKSLIRYGSNGDSNSTDIYRGIYTYGSTNYKYPDILTFDYPISTGSTQSQSLKIGLTMTVNQKLLIGWSDGVASGVDYVDDSNLCYPSATIEYLIDDGDEIWKEKEFITYVTKFKALEDGQSVLPKIKFEDVDLWTNGTLSESTSEDNTISRFIITNQRFYEMQYALDIMSTTGISPVIKGSGIEVNPLVEEGRV